MVKEAIADKIKGGLRVVGNLRIYNDHDFTAHYIKYAKEFINPATGNHYTAEEARAEAFDVRGFRDGDRIVVREHPEMLLTTIHETIHMYSADGYRMKLRTDINEGTTEHFALAVMDGFGLKRSEPVYRSQVESVRRAIDVVGEDVVADAYFKGDVKGLKDALDGARGEGTFDRWVGNFRSI